MRKTRLIFSFAGSAVPGSNCHHHVKEGPNDHPSGERSAAQVAILLLPDLERRFKYAKAAAHVYHWYASLGLSQRHLHLGESGFLHRFELLQ
jgi:hypothetical protein